MAFETYKPKQMTTFKEWLTDCHYNMAHEYRIALEREIWHTKRIFPEITKDVRHLLLQSLKEIETPKYPRYDGNASKEEQTKIFNQLPRPNYVKIMREVIEENL